MSATLPRLHFAHGNSFPTASYRMMLERLAPHYRIEALDMQAHDERFPVKDGWRLLRDEVRENLKKGGDEPAILLGHSMGGILSLMTAYKEPKRVRCVVLLDAPLVSGWRAQVLRYAKWKGLIHKVPPAVTAKSRRHVWANAQEAYAHYASKPMFAAWPEQVLHDYLDAGLVPHEEGVTLRFKRDIEAAVYASLPHDLGHYAKGRFPVPVGFVGGRDSVECRQAGLAATRKLVGKHFRQIEGGHLFTMEHPHAAADAAHAMIRELLGAS